ncbi:hypothetical protein OQA88_6697 [Cercophora sp. LCS_1]
MESTRPVLMMKVPRKSGRCDFQRFDHVASSHMQAGHGKIGKVEIDCKFKFTKSQWGVLGPNRHPAGIIYLDLDFHQPVDCRLRSATVLVTLEEDSSEEGGPGRDSSACPVKFTDNYGPKNLSGLERVMRTRQIKNFTPTFQFLGHGAGGLGIDTEKMKHTASRWKFAGHIGSSAGNIWYNQLRWELEESSLEDQPMHSNVIHTAFAIEHNKKRFSMNVKITGKLASRSKRLKSKLKFGRGLSPEETVTTVIEWRNGYLHPKRLDEIAEGLSFAMEDENLANVSLEVPDAMSAGFGQTAPVQLPDLSHRHEDVGPGIFIEEVGDGIWAGGEIPSHSPPQGLLSMGAHQPRPPEPTWENMSLAAGFEVPVADRVDRIYQRSESRWSNAVTLVDNGAESVSGRSSASRTRPKKTEEESKVKAEERKGKDNEQKDKAVAEQLFGWLLLLSWLTNTGLLCVTVVAEAIGFPLGLYPTRGTVIAGEERPEKCIKEGAAGQGYEDVRDVSDVETEGPISTTSSPMTKRITFEPRVERIGPRGRRELLIRGERENYILAEASE